LQTYSDPMGGGSSTAQEPSSTERAKEQAQQAAGQAKSSLRSQVDQRSTDAGRKVGGFASDVRSVGDQLREQGKEQPAKLADQAAERAERLGGYLTESDADRILGDVEEFGRRRPWAVIAGGLTLGFVASRFLKASSSRRYQQQSTSSNGLPARTPDVSLSTSGIHTTPVPSGPPSIEGSV
jgi:hypothetical protein